MQPPAPGEPPKIEVIREKRPSLAPEPPSRRGSLIPPADMGRRPSLIINDEVNPVFNKYNYFLGKITQNKTTSSTRIANKILMYPYIIRKIKLF